MKQTLKTLIRNVKSIKGNSLAEFATTTALMATLAATAAPKLSEMSEGAKAEKSKNEIDKIIKQGGSFYQDTADNEGRGRFPGQDKFNIPVTTNSTYAATSATEDAHETAILADIGYVNASGAYVPGTYTHFEDTHSGWTSVFGKDNEDAHAPNGHTIGADDADDLDPCNTCPQVSTAGPDEWLALFGDQPLSSQYQDGHFVYQVVAGYGSGDDAYPPVLYVADIENGSHFNNLLEP